MSRFSKYRIAAVAASATILAFFAFQIVHRARYGHFVGYGVHVDIERGDSDIGRGDMVYANITNLSLKTLQLEGAEFPNDISVKRELFHCWSVQRWDERVQRWRTWDFKSGKWDDAATPCQFTGAIAVGTREVRPLRSARHIAWVYKDWGENGDLLRIVIRQSRDPNARGFLSAAFRSHFAE